MTTQATTAIVGNAMMSRKFTDTSTDGVFESNNLTSAQSGVNLGLEMPGVSINYVQATYTDGAAIFRIIDSVTNKVSRYGMATQIGYTCMKEAMIPPYTVKSTDLLQIYPKALNSTPNDSEVLAWVVTDNGVEPFGVTTTSDNTLTEMTSLITGLSLGDYAFGRRVVKICIQTETGSNLNEVTITDQTGGTVWQAYGQHRLPSAGGSNAYYNGEYMVNIPVKKGFTIKVAATSA